MKIERFKKLKNGLYELSTENGSYTVHEDLILKYELLLKKEITDTLLKQIGEENEGYLCYEIGMKAIKNRLRSKSELNELLDKKGFSSLAKENGIMLLEKQGYLNEQSYAKAFVHDKIALSMDGPDKIRALLQKKEIPATYIEDALTEFSTDLQREKITKLITKAIQVNRNKSEKVLFQKIVLNLVQLGYQRNMILSILESYRVEDESIAKKEYEKLYHKLSLKYSGYELQMKLKQKMYQKGFSYHGED